jgi:hypothetical protein
MKRVVEGAMIEIGVWTEWNGRKGDEQGEKQRNEVGPIECLVYVYIGRERKGNPG